MFSVFIARKKLFNAENLKLVQDRLHNDSNND